MRALRAIYYAVIIGVGIDAFFFAWLLAEDALGLGPASARNVAIIAAVVITALVWAAAGSIRSAMRRRATARRAIAPTALVDSSPLVAVRDGRQEGSAEAAAGVSEWSGRLDGAELEAIEDVAEDEPVAEVSVEDEFDEEEDFLFTADGQDPFDDAETFEFEPIDEQLAVAMAAAAAARARLAAAMAEPPAARPGPAEDPVPAPRAVPAPDTVPAPAAGVAAGAEASAAEPDALVALINAAPGLAGRQNRP
jgi:hypothetical protein